MQIKQNNEKNEEEHIKKGEEKEIIDAKKNSINNIKKDVKIFDNVNYEVYSNVRNYLTDNEFDIQKFLKDDADIDDEFKTKMQNKVFFNKIIIYKS